MRAAPDPPGGKVTLGAHGPRKPALPNAVPPRAASPAGQICPSSVSPALISQAPPVSRLSRATTSSTSIA